MKVRLNYNLNLSQSIEEPEVLYVELKRQNSIILFLTVYTENILSPATEKFARHCYQWTFIFAHIRDLPLADEKIYSVLLTSESSFTMLICNSLIAFLIQDPPYWLPNYATG